MIHMKKMAAAVALAAASMGGAQATTLGTGDMSFTGWQQTSGVYGYSFVTFVDIAAGTELYITDFAWKGTSSNNGWSNSNNVEGLYKWTVGSNISAGTNLFAALYTDPVSTVQNYVPTGVYDSLTFTGSSCTNAASAVGTPGCGVATAVSNGTFTSYNVSAYGGSTSSPAIGGSDAFYIYQGGVQAGTTSGGTAISVPQISTLIAVGADTVSNNTGDNVVGLTTTAGTLYGALDPQGNLVAFNNSKKTAVYTGTRDFSGYADTASAVAALKAALQNSANYNIQNTTADPLVASGGLPAGIDTTDFILPTAAVPEPSNYAMLLAGLAIVGGIARRRT